MIVACVCWVSKFCILSKDVWATSTTIMARFCMSRTVPTCLYVCLLNKLVLPLVQNKCKPWSKRERQCVWVCARVGVGGGCVHNCLTTTIQNAQNACTSLLLISSSSFTSSPWKILLFPCAKNRRVSEQAGAQWNRYSAAESSSRNIYNINRTCSTTSLTSRKPSKECGTMASGTSSEASRARSGHPGPLWTLLQRCSASATSWENYSKQQLASGRVACSPQYYSTCSWGKKICRTPSKTTTPPSPLVAGHSATSGLQMTLSLWEAVSMNSKSHEQSRCQRVPMAWKSARRCPRACWTVQTRSVLTSPWMASPWRSDRLQVLGSHPVKRWHLQSRNPHPDRHGHSSDGQAE